MAVKPNIASPHCFRQNSIPGSWIAGFLLSAVMLAGSQILPAQSSAFDPFWRTEAAQIREELFVFTDRGLYVVEEPVHFSAILIDNRPSHYLPWSRILYVELVSPDGASLAAAKYPVSGDKAVGEIPIPAEVISGDYYLRAYTRWMRNFGPKAYCYVPIRIVNPHRSEFAEGLPPEEADVGMESPAVHASPLEFQSHPRAYGRGEEISLQLQMEGGDFLEWRQGCITVVPRLALPAKAGSMKAMGQDTDGDTTLDFQLDFLPDKYGPSLSGSVVYTPPGDEERMGSRIHFTVLGDTPAYLVCRSDQMGKFAVTLPYVRGNLELFIQPESLNGSEAEVRIDTDFDQRHLNLPANSFEWDEQDRLVLKIMARKVQLAGIYRKAALQAEKDTMAEPFPFYGSPSFTVDMDQYVLLPTLKEVFLNLVPGVTPVQRRNRNFLQIESENPTLSLFDPLIMVDQVPVLDLEKFLSISPARIQRIDVINDVYVKGDVRFGGLINLVSRDRDMAGIDLPDRSFFIDYQALHRPVRTERVPENEDDRLPDTRNTLLWWPDVPLSEAGPLSLTFTAPDYPGEYVVVFRGLDKGGELRVAETAFTVN